MNSFPVNSYDLVIRQTDEIHCSPDWSWVSNSNQWTGFHFWYVTAGGARVTVGGQQYVLRPGDCFLFDLSENHFCTHDPADPLWVKTVYFHLSPPEGSAPPVPARRQLHRPLLGELIGCVLRYDSTCRPEAAGVWLRPVIQEFFQPQSDIPPAEDSQIAALCGEIDREPWRFSKLEQLCRVTGYSKNQLIRLFQQEKGVSPYRYLIFAKINKAKSLLLYTNNTVSEIGEQLGYGDISHFSKQFKEFVGMSPQNYRRPPV